jgi:putative phage-type endonuclease
MTNTGHPQIEAAECVGNFTPANYEWHELRRGKIGGSMVATIAGLNKWESAFTAWHKFTGKISDQIPDTPAMEWGRRLEAAVLDKFADEHMELEVHRDIGTWVNKQRAYQLANPDALAVDPNGRVSVVEIKTARYPDDWQDGVPEYYKTQVQWYLSCLGLSHAYVAVLITGSDYREFELEANPLQQETDIELVEQFLASVENDTPPAWDGAQSTYETVRQLNPDIVNTDVELGQLGAEFLHLQNLANDAQHKANALKSEIMEKMGTAKIGTIAGAPHFFRRSRQGGLPYLVIK